MLAAQKSNGYLPGCPYTSIRGTCFKYCSVVIEFFHKPSSIAVPVIATKKPTINKAKTEAGARDDGIIVRRSSVSITGHTCVHARHAMHSSECTRLTLWTWMFDGHALVQSLQSTQRSRFRVIFTGLNKLPSPSNAPYGQRYRHQKFFIGMENSATACVSFHRKASGQTSKG